MAKIKERENIERSVGVKRGRTKGHRIIFRPSFISCQNIIQPFALPFARLDSHEGFIASLSFPFPSFFLPFHRYAKLKSQKERKGKDGEGAMGLSFVLAKI